MGDPEMVSRAERAAVALERAWERWRIMHGLSAEPAPPVSSYVGYSIEEPWGRPRVVFGVDAKEAELLAVLLDRHECVGPFYGPGQRSAEQAAIEDGEGPAHDGRGLPRAEVPPNSQAALYGGQGQFQDGQGALPAGQGALPPGQCAELGDGGFPEDLFPHDEFPNDQFPYGELRDSELEDNRAELYDGNGHAHGGPDVLHDAVGLLYDGAGPGHDDRGLPRDGDVGEATQFRPGPVPGDGRALIPAQAQPAEAELPNQDTIGQAGVTKAQPRGRGKGPAGTDSARPPATGQAASAVPGDVDYPEVAEDYDLADDHEAGFAGFGAGEPGHGVYASVADGLLQAVDGCDTGFADGATAEPADKRPGTRNNRSLAQPSDANPKEGGSADRDESGDANPPDPRAAKARAAVTRPAERSPGNPTGDPGDPQAHYQPTGNVSIAAELAGWAAGELPGQASARLAEWARMRGAPGESPRTPRNPGTGANGVDTAEHAR